MSKPISKSRAQPSKAPRKQRRDVRGERLVRGVKEVLAHVRGDLALPGRRYAPAVNVKAIREKAGLSQAQFASRYGFTLRALQDWEQGRRIPENSTRAYLLVIDSNPKAVE